MKKLFLITGFFCLVVTATYATHLFSTTISLNNWWADPYSVIKTLDGGTAFAGQGNGYYVIKMDSMGNIQWAANYGLGVSGSIAIVNIAQTPDSGYFVSYNGPDQMGGYCMGANVARIDKNGNLLFAKQDASTNPFVEIYCSSLKNIPGTDSVIFVEVYRTSASYINKVAANGDVVNLIATDNTTGYQFYDVFPITTAGVLEGYIAASYNVLVKMDVSGNVLWSKTYSPVLPPITNLIKEGNYYYASGFKSLLKMDSSGNVVAAVEFPSPVTGLAASSTGTLLLALANWQENYCMVEMDTLLTVMRAKKTSSISAVFSDSKTLIDGAAGVFHVVGANPGFAYEKATLDSSCSFHDTTLTVTSTTFSAANYGLPVNTPYFMDVNTDGWQWLSGSSAVSCTINLPGGTTSVSADKDPLNTISAYPNPFTDEVNVILKTNDASAAQIKVRDISGRIIVQRSIQSNTVYSFGEELKPGIYFIEALQNNSKETIRVVKDY